MDGRNPAPQIPWNADSLETNQQAIPWFQFVVRWMVRFQASTSGHSGPSNALHCMGAGGGLSKALFGLPRPPSPPPSPLPSFPPHLPFSPLPQAPPLSPPFQHPSPSPHEIAQSAPRGWGPGFAAPQSPTAPAEVGRSGPGVPAPVGNCRTPPAQNPDVLVFVARKMCLYIYTL